MKNTIGNLSNKKEMLNKLFDFDDLKDSNDKFAYYCDKLEADIQAKVYQEGGYQHTLTDQENNVVFKSSKVQKIVEDGAKTAFDIWYEYDKPIYENDEIFSNILKYVRDNNIAMVLYKKNFKSLAEIACDMREQLTDINPNMEQLMRLYVNTKASDYFANDNPSKCDSGSIVRENPKKLSNKNKKTSI